MSETGKHDEDREPKFGKKAEAWLRRQLLAKLGETRAPWGDVSVEDVVEWYLQWGTGGSPVPYYVEWKDDDEFRGHGYANGGWIVDWDLVSRDLPEAIREVERRSASAEAERHPTLDAWLLAEARGELKYRGDLGGMQFIPAEVRARVEAAAQERERRRPAICGCGASFPRDRRNARKCPKCREAARVDREKRHGSRRGK